MDYQSALVNFKPSHEFFIGIDSDGCVFDTMEVKQKEFFIPNALKCFDLYPVEKELTETWEFVNLYSVYRGGNRFTSIIKVFGLLQERLGNSKRIKLPDISSLKEWVEKETKLSNDNLLSYFRSNYDPDLEKVVNWTFAVNNDITNRLKSIPPFPHAKSLIEKMSSIADLIIVSQTPLEALEREWEENGMRKYVKIIAGQEHGTKTEHIALAAKNKYPDTKILMAGDARGDLNAAKNNGILFYPVIPGMEDKSWENLTNEGFERFISGTFSGKYEDDLLIAFNNSLPETPPWKI